MTSQKGHVQIENKRGPSAESCGAPMESLHGDGDETYRWEENHWHPVPCILRLMNKTVLCQTQLKGRGGWECMRVVDRAACSFSMTSKRLLSVEYVALKLDWIGSWRLFYEGDSRLHVMFLEKKREEWFRLIVVDGWMIVWFVRMEIPLAFDCSWYITRCNGPIDDGSDEREGVLWDSLEC